MGCSRCVAVPLSAPGSVQVMVPNSTLAEVQWEPVPLASVQGKLQGYKVQFHNNVTCMLEFLFFLQLCVTLFRCTTAVSVAFMKLNRSRSRRSRSWHSVGTVARDGCQASSPTASTTSSSGSLIIKEKVHQAKATDLRLLKGVCTDDSYVVVFVNQTFSSRLLVFSEEDWWPEMKLAISITLSYLQYLPKYL